MAVFCDLYVKGVMPFTILNFFSFCTSGGTGVGRSDIALHKNVTEVVNWVKGRQINRPNDDEIRRWLDEML